MNPSKKEFNQLKKEWYKKLKDSGFDDIETDDDNLKYWEVSRVRQVLSNGDLTSFIRIEAKIEYYRLAEQFLYTHKFESARDKKIWELHAQGVSLRELGEIFKCSHVQIFHTIKLLKNICLKKTKVKNNE